MRNLASAGRALAMSAVVLAACASPAPRAPSALAAIAPRRSPQLPVTPGSFWELVEIDLGSTPGIELPLAEDAIARTEGATRLWEEVGSAGQKRLREAGLLTIEDRVYPSANGGAGELYVHFREQRVPLLVTIDALFVVAHAVVQRALAEVEEDCLEPALDAFLTLVALRLDEGRVTAGGDLADAYRIARGVVAVARSLLGYPAPLDLADVVRVERTRIETRAPAQPSAIVGVPIDYGQFVVPSAAARPGSFRALAWLAAAPLALVARSEEPTSPVDTGAARTNSRAAMLLARFVDRGVDPAGFESYARVTRLLDFVWGTPDDIALEEIALAASTVGVDLAKREDIANVVRVDRVRAKLRAGRVPTVWDGGIPNGRGGIAVRLFGGNAAADSVVLSSLVGTHTGRALEAAPRDYVRGNRRVLPSALDFAAWLGTPDARALVRDSKLDAFDGYDAALARAIATRPDSEGVTLHKSVHGSFLDTLLHWAESDPPPLSGLAARRARIESILASWTLVRHLGQPLGRPKAIRPSSRRELRIAGAPLATFVEAEPRVLARLLATVRQVAKGLLVLGPLPAKSTALVALAELEDVLWLSLRVASRMAAGKMIQAEDTALLASLPARLSNLEADSPGENGPVAVAVHNDLPSGTTLVEATGALEPTLTVVRDPGSSKLLLVVALHASHFELVERSRGGMEPTDAAWRARRVGAKPPRAAWTAPFRAPW